MNQAAGSGRQALGARRYQIESQHDFATGSHPSVAFCLSVSVGWLEFPTPND